MVEQVVENLNEKKKEWEDQAEDRRLRNHTETLEVDPIFHSKIIGIKVNIKVFYTTLKFGRGLPLIPENYFNIFDKF